MWDVKACMITLFAYTKSKFYLNYVGCKDYNDVLSMKEKAVLP